MRLSTEQVKSIYQRVPVLLREQNFDQTAQNPWNIRFLSMFHMSSDSYLFKTYHELTSDGFSLDGNILTSKNIKYLPLYESKMINILTHRHGDFRDSNHERAHVLPAIPIDRLSDPNYLVMPYYWVNSEEVSRISSNAGWSKNWFLVWRNITDSRASARTLKTTVIPLCGVGNSLPIFMPSGFGAKHCALLLANLSSLVIDYIARMKVGGLNFNYFIFNQLSVLPPDRYSDFDIAFIVPRILELTYTAHDLTPWARDLGFEGAPFPFISDRRASLCAELDAYYAMLYGLTRDELRYILDPADVMGPDYPSETFRGLKSSDIENFGEYRTRRLILTAWDSLNIG